MSDVLNDVIAEQSRVDTLVSHLSEAEWNAPIPDEETWLVKDVIIHIALYDYAACQMLKGTYENARIAVNAVGGTDSYKRSVRFRDMSGEAVLEWWRKTRIEMDALFASKDMKDKVNWAPGVPPMSARSLLTARHMELWAHSVDICKALNKEITIDDSITNTLFLSWQARPNAYRINGYSLPDTPVYLELRLPSGAIWSKGEANAENYIKGSAKQWALVAVRRLNWLDTELEVHGEEAKRFASIVQTYAGDAEKAPPAKRNTQKQD